MTSSPSIPMVTVVAPTNIAVIKYWGKADVANNTPINDSLSVTLDTADLAAVTTVAASLSFTHHRLWLNGKEEDVTEANKSSSSKRFRTCIEQVRRLATCDKFSSEEWQSMNFHVSSYNTFPTAAGLASSAAGYAALTYALVQLCDAKEEFPGQFTTICRRGSGSASRSWYGGIVAWRHGPAVNDSIAEPVCSDWKDLRALILVVSDEKKGTPSTNGMQASVETSALLKERARTVVPERMNRMEKACKEHDFDTFAELSMQDSNQFHAVCLDTFPPIFYLNDTSRTIIRLVHAYNTWLEQEKKNKMLKVASTFDAGPNAVLYCVGDECLTAITALVLHFFPPTGPDYLASPTMDYSLDPSLVAACEKVRPVVQAGDVRKLYATRVGDGPCVTQDVCNLDPATGLNTFVKK